MPFYTYRCKECSKTQKELKRIDDRNETQDMICESCSLKGTLKLIITGAPCVGYNTAPGLKTSDNFNARLQEITKTKGKGHTISTRKSPI